ncbi:MAG TPA: CRISPR-associated protein Cas4 [Sedimentisphaerales bacterium]|nr:CRISPR-associated protein Cas4 [Sedimentisphaerales bacterium]
MDLMHSEEELLPISALQHLSFCERQWALIHLEQVWSENLFTAEGRNLHEKTHEADCENRPGLRIVRGLRLRCLRLGLVGQADVVEFHKAEAGVPLDGVAGLWRPFPVEYKRGKAKPDNCDRVQLCGQAICLEEMLRAEILAGALFYGRPRRRETVEFTPELRNETELLALRLHELHAAGRTPKARYGPKCKSCSLLEVCLPKITGPDKDIAHYLAKALEKEP